MDNRQKGAFVHKAIVLNPQASDEQIKAIVEELGRHHRKPGPPRPGDTVTIPFIRRMRRELAKEPPDCRLCHIGHEVGMAVRAALDGLGLKGCDILFWHEVGLVCGVGGYGVEVRVGSTWRFTVKIERGPDIRDIGVGKAAIRKALRPVMKECKAKYKDVFCH